MSQNSDYSLVFGVKRHQGNDKQGRLEKETAVSQNNLPCVAGRKEKQDLKTTDINESLEPRNADRQTPIHDKKHLKIGLRSREIT